MRAGKAEKVCEKELGGGKNPEATPRPGYHLQLDDYLRYQATTVLLWLLPQQQNVCAIPLEFTVGWPVLTFSNQLIHIIFVPLIFGSFLLAFAKLGSFVDLGRLQVPNQTNSRPPLHHLRFPSLSSVLWILH